MENMDAMLKSTVEIFSKIDHSRWINADIESIKLLTDKEMKDLSGYASKTSTSGYKIWF